MPVEMLISCLFPEPGWQSRLIATEMLVSFVLRSSVAVRAAIFFVLEVKVQVGVGVREVCILMRKRRVSVCSLFIRQSEAEDGLQIIY